MNRNYLIIDRPFPSNSSYGILEDWIPVYKQKIKRELKEKFLSNFKSFNKKIKHPILYLRERSKFKDALNKRNPSREFISKAYNILSEYSDSIRTREEHDEIILKKNAKSIKKIDELKTELSDLVGETFLMF